MLGPPLGGILATQPRAAACGLTLLTTLRPTTNPHASAHAGGYCFHARRPPPPLSHRRPSDEYVSHCIALQLPSDSPPRLPHPPPLSLSCACARHTHTHTHTHTGLKRVNLTNLKLEAVSQRLAKELRERCLSTREGIYWGPEGRKEVQL